MISAVIEVAGNTLMKTTPPFTFQEFNLSWTDPSHIVAESPDAGKQELKSMLPNLQAILLYRFLDPIQLYVPILSQNDIILHDVRIFQGPAPSRPMSSDIPRIRDVILEYELAAGSRTRTALLRGSAPMLYAIEHLVRAILTPQAPLPEIYKAIESIKHVLGGWSSFRSIGVKKDYVDFIKSRANIHANDQRHAPSDPVAVSEIPAIELRECLVRAREVIVSYANSL